MSDPIDLYSVVSRVTRAAVYRSIPATIFPTLRIWAGLHRLSAAAPVTVLTFSVYPDLSRLWHYYATKHLPPHTFAIVLVDCVGSLRAQDYPGAHLLRFVNLYHGRKIDVLLRRVIRSRYVLLLDDDKFVINAGISGLPDFFDAPDVAAVSLSPRWRWQFVIDGRRFAPIGSYAVCIDREVYLREGLSFRPRRDVSTCKEFLPGQKVDLRYDTGDYANEILLRRGCRTVVPDQAYRDSAIAGFDGSSYCGLLFRAHRKPALRRMLLETSQTSGTFTGIMQCAYTNAKLTQLYRRIFGHEPQQPAPFSEAEMLALLDHVRDNAKREELAAYYEKADAIADRLAAAA